MKRFVSLLLTFAMIFALTGTMGCNKGAEKKDDKKGATDAGKKK